MRTLVLPSEVKDANVFDFIERLREEQDCPEPVRFDFSAITFATPFASLILALSIRSFRDHRKRFGLETVYSQHGVTKGTRPEGSSYLAEMGFFKLLGIKQGKNPGQAPGSRRYVPIHRIEMDPFAGWAQQHDEIERQSGRLATVLFPREDDAHQFVRYCLRETIRNVFEHAHVVECLVFAQSYPSKAEAEVAVVDSGRGVLASLSEAFPEFTAEEAVSKAILPGVSRCIKDEGRGEWEPCGYGLYAMSEMAKATGGKFVLWSSGVRLVRSEGEDPTVISASALTGTAVQIRIGANEFEYPNLMKLIVERGEGMNVPGAVTKKGRSKSKYGGWA